MGHLYRTSRFTGRLRAARTLDHHDNNTPGRGLGNLGIHHETDIEEKWPGDDERDDEGRGGRA
jgi:hypothetical protein